MKGTVMAQETSFKDALDFIYVANNVDSNSYLITNDNDDDGAATDDDDFIANNGGLALIVVDENDDDSNNNTNYSNNNKSKNNYDMLGNDRISTRAKTRTRTTRTTNAAITAAAAVNMTTLPAATTPMTTITTTTTTATITSTPTGLPSATLSAAAAAAATAMLSNVNSNAAATTVTNTTTTVAATAAATFAAMATDAASINFAGVAVGLGAMLINDTLLMDVNGTSGYFGEIINGTYYTTTINSSIDNVTSTDEDFTETLKMVATSVVLGLMILITIIGNVFVIAAIILERNLQNVANYLVASLAVADLLVACLVMPLGAVYEISNGWILGPELCDIWTSCDVLCCTASILHLVAIAMDRYWAVTNIDYIHSRTSRRVFMMIFCVWSAAVIVSLAPQFGWKDPDYLQRIEQQKCMVSQDIAYQVFATCCTFYVPLMVILALYWKIYQTARKRIHRRRPRPVDVTANNNQPVGSAQKKRKRLRLRFGRFAADKTNNDGNGSCADVGDTAAPSNATALCIIEGNSTNTVNTVEDTEFSSSNMDNKSRAGIEVPTTSSSQISTVSHLVALANQQHASSTKQHKASNAVGQKHQTTNVAESATVAATALDGNTVATLTATTTLTTSAENAMESTVTEATANNSAGTFNANAPTKFTIVESTGTVNGSAAIEVLADPQLQQQLEQVQRQQEQQQQQQTAKMSTSKGNVTVGGASTSNATTITSISALSPQTPPGAANLAAATSTSSTATMTAGGAATSTTTTTGNTLTSGNQTTAPPLCSSSTNASGQVTPVPRAKQQPQQQQQQQQQLSSIANPMQKVNKRKETLEAKRERKAAKTLAIITGAFVVCWLPFFVMAITMPLCSSCEISDGVSSLFLWLGYFNSTLNPVIYTIFSPEFRQAFKRILFGGHRPVHYRSGKL